MLKAGKIQRIDNSSQRDPYHFCSPLRRNPFEITRLVVVRFGAVPENYVIDKHRRLVITTAWGVLTFQDCARHQDRLINDPEFDPTYNQLLDFSNVSSIELDNGGIRFLMVRHVFSGQSWRAVVGNDTQQFSEFALKAMELRKVFLGNESIRIFSDREEALRWLSAEKET